MASKGADPARAFDDIVGFTPPAIEDVNALTVEAFQTRGGRIGSGLGGVIEALWGFSVNKLLRASNSPVELGWISGHEYNDFSVIERDADWDPDSKQGELFRVEVKSMVKSADESKAHFDRLDRELSPADMLCVFLWDWVAVPDAPKRMYPKIIDSFSGRAGEIALLRDNLHVARGGSFVQSGNCPDRCKGACRHVGEPLNAAGIRERKSGPESARGGKVSFAANFGGLKRMLGVRGSAATKVLRDCTRRESDAAKYVEFIYRNFDKKLPVVFGDLLEGAG